MSKMDAKTGERRSELRFDIGNEAVLVDLLDGREPVACCLWNASSDGACLMVAPNLAMPPRFKVISGGLSHTVIQIWRDQSHIGIKFVDDVESDEPIKQQD